MGKQDWLEEGETILGSWSVYVIKAIQAGKSCAGKIYVTDRYVRFDSEFVLGHVKEGIRTHLLLVNDGKHLAVPYDQIAKAQVQKQFFIMKNLALNLKSGEEMTFRFGVLSPQKACEAIMQRIT